MAPKTALITGASSGFGLLTAVTLARRGWRVLATMRDVGRREKLDAAAKAAGVADRVEVMALDVTNAEQVAECAARVGARGEPLHALINNAGFAMAGFAEDVTDAELRRQFDTNFFGAAAMTRAVLPQMRRQGFGHIVMVSSVSGRMGFPGVGSYSASKFALEGWTETLRYEVKAQGIQVSIVEPGAYETDIWTRNAVPAAGLTDPESENAARSSRWRTAMNKSTEKRADPQIVAETIASIVERKKPRLRYVPGRDAKMGLTMRRLLAESVVERFVMKEMGVD